MAAHNCIGGIMAEKKKVIIDENPASEKNLLKKNQKVLLQKGQTTADCLVQLLIF